MLCASSYSRGCRCKQCMKAENAQRRLGAMSRQEFIEEFIEEVRNWLSDNNRAKGMTPVELDAYVRQLVETEADARGL